MTPITQFLTQHVYTQQRPAYGLIGLWVLAMICLPILKWIFGDAIIPTAVTVALLLQFSAVIATLSTRLPWDWIMRTVAIAAFITWGAEFIGSKTGFPFGTYTYTDLLQPQIGHVPLLVPLAWFMMFPAAWTVAQILAGRHNRLAYIAISAAAMTAWDLFLDPQMVAWEFWQWENPTGYFGIPWSNYAGWLLVSALITMVIRPDRHALPGLPLLIIYGVVWFLQTFGQAVFWGQVGPAVVGGFVMGFFFFSAAGKMIRDS